MAIRGARLLTAVLAVTVGGGCVAINVEHRSDMPIAAARMQAVKTSVMVEGIVTVAPGTFDEGFAVQDASGGIYVTRAIAAGVKAGDRVRASGAIAVVNGQTVIEPAQVQMLGAGSLPAPLDTRTGTVGPVTEGKLVAVRGKVAGDVIDDQPWGWKLYLDDGSGPVLVFISTPTAIDIRNIRSGLSLRVTGFNGRYDKHTEVLPRSPGDIATITR